MAEKILYVAGYGRSGSTIFDIILGNHPCIVSVGEVGFLLEELQDPQRMCACGKPYRECEFWRDLLADPACPPLAGLEAIIDRHEATTSLPRLILNRYSKLEQQQYTDYHRHLYDYIRSRSGCPIVVDSSKSAWKKMGRFWALKKRGHEVYVLHIVRNGLATLESFLLTGSNWVLEGYREPPRFQAMRAIVGWLAANVLASFLGKRMGPGRYLRLRYEDLIADPEVTLQEVAQFIECDSNPLLQKIRRHDDFAVGHLVGGNRVRFQGKIRLREALPEQYGAKLQGKPRVLFYALAGWLHCHFGYC